MDFFLDQSFWLYPRSLVYITSVKYGILFVKWTLSQIKHFPTTSMPPLLQHIAGRTDGRSKTLWLGCCPNFSFGSPWSNFSHQKDQNIRVKAPCRHQIDFSMNNELHVCYPHQGGPTVSLWRATLCLYISLDFLGIFMLPPCPKALLNATHSLHQKPCLATRDGQLRPCPHQDHLHGFQDVSTILGFSTHLKCPPIPGASPKLSPFHHISPSPPELFPFQPTYLQSTHKTFSIPPSRKIRVSSLDASLPHNPSESTELSFI